MGKWIYKIPHALNLTQIYTHSNILYIFTTILNIQIRIHKHETLLGNTMKMTAT